METLTIEKKQIKPATQIWWNNLEPQWKKAFNEAMLGRGPIEDMPSEKEINEILECPTFRFAGPQAHYPNMSFELTNLSGLDEMKQAELIVITFHKIISIKPITGLHNLKAIYLNDNEIMDLDGLKKLWQLKNIMVSNNHIQSLEPLSELKHLESLDASNNKLKSFAGLNEKNTDKMTTVILSRNKVAQTEIDRLQNDLRLRVR